MKKFIVGITILVSLIAVRVGSSGVQTELPPPERVPNNFPDLARLRTRLVEGEIPQARKGLTQLRRRQESAVLREKFYEGELATVKRQIELLQRQEPPNPSEVTSLEKNSRPCRSGSMRRNRVILPRRSPKRKRRSSISNSFSPASKTPFRIC
jgi:hypothetical protein